LVIVGRPRPSLTWCAIVARLAAMVLKYKSPIAKMMG
jgi:hypothetical protein